ncbi:histone deacetylase [Lentisphaera marina]|uniref:histone deacetylase family protein n=1 Tax=Lentisphaera marina TaxID=1111041 RepID=UPI002366976B|nr:histone deacetylase [Lentisphaera marina]MDD7983743.1 histone deacetylase [Lentisphaera marina]
MIKVAYKDNYSHSLWKNHPFPMEKYELLRKQIQHQGILEDNCFFEPEAISVRDILLCHTSDYWHRLESLQISDKEMKKVGFPLSQELLDRELDITGGTFQLALWALENACGLNIAGGTHHAFSDHGEGYCLLNDHAIAIRALQHRQMIERALIVDLDVHQGNGSAEIFEKDKSVFTFSMHGARNYPTRKEKSDLDLAFECETGDEIYLNTLEEHLPRIIDEHQPDIIFYLAGVDVLEGDRFGRLSLSMQGVYNRDEYVLSLCKQLSIPIVITMGGGYSRSLAKIIDAHSQVFRLASKVFT